MTKNSNESVNESNTEVLNFDEIVEESDENEETSTNEEETTLKDKKDFPAKSVIIGIIILLVVAGAAFFGFKLLGNNTKVAEYQKVVISGAKEYYSLHNDELPAAPGQCNTIALEDLYKNNLISKEDKDLLDEKSCNVSTTTVKVCKLESGSYHYVADLSCKDKSLTPNYGEWKEGTENDLISDKSDVKFAFLVQQMEVPVDLNKIPNETFWANEIPYKLGEYTTVGQQVYYRYREKTYKWYYESTKYYPKDESNPNKVSQYYPTQPHKDYNKKGSSATVYRWYIGANQVYNNGNYYSEPQGVYTVKGEPGPNVVKATTDRPLEKDYRTIQYNVNVYRLREVASTEVLTNTKYRCKNTTTGTWWDSEDPCDEDLSQEAGTVIIDKYFCTWKNDKTNVVTNSQTWQDDPCENKYNYKNGDVNEGYGEWLSTNCGYNASAKPYVCDRRTGFIYTDKVWKWYTPATKTYLNDVFGKPVYYAESPSAQALKDQGTATTGYKWYKSEKIDLGYSKTAPQANAIKEGEGWTSWSKETLSKPAPADNRQVEERIKLTIKKTVSENTTWKDITEGYVTEQEAIDVVNNLGNKIGSLTEILELPSFRYLVKVYYRNY